MHEQIAVKLDDVSKVYKLYNSPVERLAEALHPLKRIYHKDFFALKNINYTIKKGEFLGIIGKNGSGKSTLLKILSGVLKPTSGHIFVEGAVSALLELGAGFNPELSGIENIYFNGMLMGFTRDQVDSKLESILNFADIGSFAMQPVKNYSSGMFVRLAFATAISINPDILIVDEALSVGDIFFQQKCYKKIEDLKNKSTTIILVTHALTDVVRYCDRALLLESGQIEFSGDPHEAVKRYLMNSQKSSLEIFRKENNDNRDENPIYCSSQWPKVRLSSIDGKSVVENGIATCTGVSILNDAGEKCNVFYQGEAIIIFCEFYVKEAIEIPVCGYLIKNRQNIMVHGKNTLHYDNLNIPDRINNFSRIMFKFRTELLVAPGDYTIDIGLSTIRNTDYSNNLFSSVSRSNSLSLRLCHISNVSCIQVLEATVTENKSKIYHNGICNLPSNAEFWCTREKI